MKAMGETQEEYYRGVRMVPYDLVKELALALAGVGILALAVSAILSSPDVPPVTVAAWAQNDPVDFATTATGELAGSTDWLWMSLMRAGRKNDAQAMLARKPDSLAVTNAYARRLKLYRGEIGPDEVFLPSDTADIQVATLSYGVGNWFFLQGDTTRAKTWFERSIKSGGWPAFGFIMSEVELDRLSKKKD